MPVRIGTKIAGTLVATAAVLLGTLPVAPASAREPTYTVAIGSRGLWGNPDDTPAAPYVDKDGTFYYQQSALAVRRERRPRLDVLHRHGLRHRHRGPARLSNAVNPNNPRTRTTTPPGAATTARPAAGHRAPAGIRLRPAELLRPDRHLGRPGHRRLVRPGAQRVHPAARSATACTTTRSTTRSPRTRATPGTSRATPSPRRTARSAATPTAFPHQTYDYGDGDPRLFVDTASGYFYVYYGSRVVTRAGLAAGRRLRARRPRSDLRQDGAGHLAEVVRRRLVPARPRRPGEQHGAGRRRATPPATRPSRTSTTRPTPGTVDQQIAAGQMPAKSPLFIMNIAYDAYLGLYIGEPEAVDQRHGAAAVLRHRRPRHPEVVPDRRHRAATAPLPGTAGSSTAANKTSNTVVGKTFRSYCSFGCANGSDGEYVDVTIGSTAPGRARSTPRKTYRSRAATAGSSPRSPAAPRPPRGRAPTGSALEAWTFTRRTVTAPTASPTPPPASCSASTPPRRPAAPGVPSRPHGAGPAGRPSGSSGSSSPAPPPAGGLPPGQPLQRPGARRCPHTAAGSPRPHRPGLDRHHRQRGRRRTDRRRADADVHSGDEVVQAVRPFPTGPASYALGGRTESDQDGPVRSARQIRATGPWDRVLIRRLRALSP